MNWAREVALRIIEERPNEEIYTVASGVSPSGFPPLFIVSDFTSLLTNVYIMHSKKLYKENENHGALEL